MKYALIIGAVALVLLAGGSWMTRTLQSNDPDVIATGGVHWHPELTVYVKMEKIEIPANIGIGGRYAEKPTYDATMHMTAMHTHAADGVIHLEFPGRVTHDDVKLGNLFRIWGKSFTEFGSTVSMTVNGKENTELENYEMGDGDRIVLKYE